MDVPTDPIAASPPAGLDPAGRRHRLFALARDTTGFMPDEEGEALYHAAVRAGTGAGTGSATFVEVGAWCGKSTVYLGAAAEVTGAVLFSLDHHHGSEENQPGWEHHDSTLVDPATGRIDTLPHWRRTIVGGELESSVIGVVGDSATASSHWSTPLAFCFIDGGHGEGPAWADYHGWSPLVAVGGWLAIHDVFPDPADGGRPPYDLWRAALESREFAEDGECGSLRVLKRIAPCR
ncbi:MAG: class I SAM-dependent methyltransferase [Acidimicrobiales bacterium]